MCGAALGPILPRSTSVIMLCCCDLEIPKSFLNKEPTYAVLGPANYVAGPGTRRHPVIGRWFSDSLAAWGW